MITATFTGNGFLPGSQLGTVVGTIASGWLCSSSVLGGWPLVFYVFGASGLVWALAWWCLVSERPEDHPGLSEAELKKLKLHQECVKGTEVKQLLEERWRWEGTGLMQSTGERGAILAVYIYAYVLHSVRQFIHRLSSFSCSTNLMLKPS